MRPARPSDSARAKGSVELMESVRAERSAGPKESARVKGSGGSIGGQSNGIRGIDGVGKAMRSEGPQCHYEISGPDGVG